MDSIDRDRLIFEIKSCIVNIVGRIGLEIENIDDLRDTTFWDELETEFPGQLFERFNINIDITSLNPLTLDNIADYIEQEQACDLSESGLTEEPREKEILDLPFLKHPMVIGL